MEDFSAVGNSIREIFPGLFRIRLPQPRYGSVYVHLAKGGSGPLTLFDAGLPHPLTQNALRRHLGELDVSVSDLEQIVYTHSHIDHMGGGSVISGLTDRPKHIAFQGCLGVCEDYQEYNRRASSWKSLIQHLSYTPGMKDRIVQLLPIESRAKGNLLDGNISVEDADQTYHLFDKGAAEIRFDRGISDGDSFEAGPYAWSVIETPGHNPHHVVLVESENRFSVTGDMILDHGTPIMRSMGDDVSVYLASLLKLRRTVLGTALTSHGCVFPDGNTALCRVLEEREALLEWVWAAIQDRPQRLVDISMAAGAAGVAGKKVNPMLLMGVLDSAVHVWSERGAVWVDPSNGIVSIKSDKWGSSADAEAMIPLDEERPNIA
ncbi:MAG: MBL fold metallo-hydrolase [Deltaproteobacteria bacterium]|nr:MBL fold metallo-hydrolase [Deltaproteobacteria bacterium]